MKSHRIIQIILLLAIAFFLSAILGSLIHEGSHVLVRQAGGGQLKEIVVIPGIQLYPHLAKVKWSGYVAGVSITKCPEPFFNGLSMIMGSSSNAIASYLLLIPVFLMRSGWRIKIIFILVSLVLAWDLIAYSLFPLLGLRHLIFLGGDYAEPVYGASMLGIPLWISYVIVCAHAFLYHLIIVKALSPSAELRS